jgi:hypothetical protein
VPRGASFDTEREAVEIVRAEEVAKGWMPGPPLGQRAQALEGCDFLSTPPEGGPGHPIEVKGWSEPIVGPDGSIQDLADINVEQLKRAKADPNWRLEIVANLADARVRRGRPQRLTLTAAEVAERARGWRYRVELRGLAGRVTEVVADGP